MSEIHMPIILISVIAKTLQQVESNKAQGKKSKYSLELFKVDHDALNNFIWLKTTTSNQNNSKKNKTNTITKNQTPNHNQKHHTHKPQKSRNQHLKQILAF